MELRYQEIASAYPAMNFKRLGDKDQQTSFANLQADLKNLSWFLGYWVFFFLKKQKKRMKMLNCYFKDETGLFVWY